MHRPHFLLFLCGFFFGTHLAAYGGPSCASIGLSGATTCTVANWGLHTCGSSTFADSPPIVPGGAAVNTIINRHLACCLKGWDSPEWSLAAVNTAANKGHYKFDCTELTLQGTGAGSFDTLYNSFATASATRSSGLTRPARLFLYDAVGNPVSGFYRDDGTRCVIASTTDTQLLTLMETALASAATTTNTVFPTGVGSDCRWVLRAAVETVCPQTSTGPATDPIFRFVTPDSAVRCRAAQSVRILYDLRDIANTVQARRGRMRTFTTSTSAPANTVSGQTVQLWMQQWFPRTDSAVTSCSAGLLGTAPNCIAPTPTPVTP